MPLLAEPILCPSRLQLVFALILPPILDEQNAVLLIDHIQLNKDAETKLHDRQGDVGDHAQGVAGIGQVVGYHQVAAPVAFPRLGEHQQPEQEEGIALWSFANHFDLSMIEQIAHDLDPVHCTLAQSWMAPSRSETGLSSMSRRISSTRHAVMRGPSLTGCG